MRLKQALVTAPVSFREHVLRTIGLSSAWWHCPRSWAARAGAADASPPARRSLLDGREPGHVEHDADRAGHVSRQWRGREGLRLRRVRARVSWRGATSGPRSLPTAALTPTESPRERPECRIVRAIGNRQGSKNVNRYRLRAGTARERRSSVAADAEVAEAWRLPVPSWCARLCGEVDGCTSAIGTGRCRCDVVS